MKYRALFCMAITILFISCGHSHNKNLRQDSKDISCIVAGNDSIIFYIGTSDQMQEIKKGKITDTVLLNDLGHTVMDNKLFLILKPGDGANMVPNMQDLITWLNDHEVLHGLVDTIDVNEQKAFGFSTPPQVKDALKGAHQQFKLQLPKEDASSDTFVKDYPKASQLEVLLYGDSDIYAYAGGNMHSGKKYTYIELTETLKAKKTDKKLIVLLRVSATSSYKNTVNILDIMKTADIKQYALQDITKAQEDYLREIYK